MFIVLDHIRGWLLLRKEFKSLTFECAINETELSICLIISIFVEKKQ